MRTAGFEGSMAFWVRPAGRFLTSAWLSSSKVGPKGFRAVIKLKACRTNIILSTSETVQQGITINAKMHVPKGALVTKPTTMPMTAQLMTFWGSRVSSCSWPRAPLPVNSSPMTAEMKPVTA